MFKLELNARARIAASNEAGTVVGRAEYPNDENTYLLRYQAGDGRAVQEWWSESALEAAE